MERRRSARILRERAFLLSRIASLDGCTCPSRISGSGCGGLVSFMMSAMRRRAEPVHARSLGLSSNRRGDDTASPCITVNFASPLGIAEIDDVSSCTTEMRRKARETFWDDSKGLRTSAFARKQRTSSSSAAPGRTIVLHLVQVGRAINGGRCASFIFSLQSNRRRIEQSGIVRMRPGYA